MTLRIVSAPTVGLVELSRAKQDLRVESGDHDFLIQRLIRTATARVEAMTQRRYITQTLEWVLPRWPGAVIRLPVAGVNTVTSVTYVDANGTTQTLSTDDYVVSPDGATLSLRMKRGQCWPLVDDDAAEPIVIRFTAGGDQAAVPHQVQTAAMLFVGQLYDNPEKGTTPEGVADLLWDEMWA